MSVNKVAKGRLLFMLVLTSVYFLVEITVGYVNNSMALVADSFHMLSDVVALVIAFVSVLMSPKKWSKNTFGWARAEILGALVNAVFLCALCFSILIESIERFTSPQRLTRPFLILMVGLTGLMVNIIGLFLFKEGHGHTHVKNNRCDDNEITNEGDGCDDSKTNPQNAKLLNNTKKNKIDPRKKTRSSQQMNMRAVFLHVMADAIGSVIVCLSAGVVMWTDWEAIKLYIDPTLSVIMVTLIIYSTWPLLNESSMILLQTVPTHIEIESLQKKLLQEIDGVLAVHELHVWQLAGDKIIASAHIRCHNLQDYMRIAEKVKEFFHNEGIHSTTIQPEFVAIEFEQQSIEDQENCVLDCPESMSCAYQTCCGPKREIPKFNIQNNPCDMIATVRRRAKNADELLEIPLSEIEVETADDHKEVDDSRNNTVAVNII